MKTPISWAHAAARLMGPGLRLPAYVIQFVTHRCDARCGHCFFWRQLNDRSCRELGLEEFDALAKSLGPTLQVTLTGGSPELRHDLPQIAEAFHRWCHPVNITVCFNGYHTQTIVSQVSDMLARCPEQRFAAGISLDGIGKTHETLRGMPGLFDRVIQTLEGLHRLKLDSGRLQLICAVCISELNHDSAEATVRWARKNLPVDLVKPILVRGEPQKAEAIGRHAAKTYLRTVKTAGLSIRAKSCTGDWFEKVVTAKERLQRDLICGISQTGKSPVRCSAARETAVIYADGVVAACELREERLGNLREFNMDFPELWQAARARQFRTSLKQTKCTCYHHCFLAPMIFRSPKLWVRLGHAMLASQSPA